MHSEVSDGADEGKTNGQLIDEIRELRREIARFRESDDGDAPATLDRAGSLLGEIGRLKSDLQSMQAEAETGRSRLRRQVEELAASNRELDASERRYRAIGELIPYGFWIADQEGNVEQMSRAFSDLTGMSGEELRGMGWTKALQEEDRARTARDWKECVARGGHWDYELRVIGKDGQPRTILSRGLPVKDERGHVTSWAGINLDITGRKWAEEELRLSDRMFNVLVNANIIGIFVSGSDGTIIEANDSYLGLVGYTREDLRAGAVNCNRMTPPEFWKLHRRKETELITDGYMSPHEKEYLRKDGSRVPVLLGMGLLDRSSFARIGYVIDLTEGRRREMMLRRYRMMFETIRDPILFIRRDGAIVDANYAAVEFYGYSHSELMSMNVGDLRVMGEKTELLEKLEQCFKHGCQFEAVHRRKDDSTIILDISTKGMVFNNDRVLVAVARDITDRKRSEELLRHRQRELEAVLDTLPGYVVFKDTSSVYVMANRKACEAMGVTKASVAGRTDYDLYPRRLAEKYRADDWRAISSGRALYDMEETMPCGGRTATVITSKVPLKNDLGQVVGIIGLSLDISSRKQAEEALLRSRSSLARAERIASLGHWEWDFRTGRFLWSDGYYRIFGYQVGECEPSYEAWKARIHPDDAGRVETALDATVLRDKPFKIDYRVAWPDGSVRHVHAESDRPGRDQQGNPVRMFGVVQDITERKRIEDELREREADLSEAQQVAHLGSWVWDIAEDRSRWSDEAWRIFGLAPQPSAISLAEMLGCVHPDDRELVRRTIGESVATGAAYDQEYNIVRADGTGRVVHSRAKVLLGSDGKPARMHGTMRDVTEQRQGEKTLQRAKAQTELYMDLMGHDINNMNQVALGSLEFAREAALEEGGQGRDVLAYIDRTAEALRNSSTLIDNVRKLRNQYLGRYRQETVDLAQLLGEIRDHCPVPPGREVSISLSAPPGCAVIANELLRDAFANIVGNAIGHSTGPVRVGIALDRAMIADTAYCRVTIEDDGPGIPDWKKWQVFERLKMGETSGKGFGLYMVKTIVDHCRGMVWVEDRVSGDSAKGSRFVVLLPAA